MSTGALIGIYDKDMNWIECIYAIRDGHRMYPTLSQYYNSEEKAKELISLGNIVDLGPKVKPEDNGHSFANPYRDVTLALHRDRGDRWGECMPTVMFERHFKPDSDVSHVYLFKNGTWEHKSI